MSLILSEKSTNPANFNSLILITLVMLLSCLGCLLLYSAGGCSVDPWVRKQLCALALGLLVMITIANIDRRWVYRATSYSYLLSILLLAGAEFWGRAAMGAQRWINISGINFQPSELVKITVILILSRCYRRGISLPSIIRGTIYLLLPLFFIYRQPNLGTCTVIALTAAAIIFIAGLNWKVIIAAVLIGVMSAPLAWQCLHDYQKRRVIAFFQPEQNLLGSGYNVMQSKIAIGSGGFIGKGLCHGTQARLSFLPEKHTDFIITILAEELGFWGVLVVLSTYAGILLTIYAVGIGTHRRYSRLVCTGVSSLMFCHIAVNVGMVSGLLPAVGIPLPFLSYGGSNLITMFAAIGLVLNVSANTR